MVVGVPLGLLAGFYGFLDPVVSRLTDTLLVVPVPGPGGRPGRDPRPVAVAPRRWRSASPAYRRSSGSPGARRCACAASTSSPAAVADGAERPGRAAAGTSCPTRCPPSSCRPPWPPRRAIIGEAVLSFLGLGIQPPTPSLGVMLAGAQPLFRDAPWLAVLPGRGDRRRWRSALNLLGDGLRDALDPRETRAMTALSTVAADLESDLRRSAPRTARCSPSTTASFEVAERRGAGPGRRVRLRQERHRHGADQPAAAQRHRLRHRPPGTTGRCSPLSESGLRDIRGREIAYVFQEPMTSLNPVLTVGRQIGEVLRRHQQLRGAARASGARPNCSSWSASRCRSGGCASTRTSSPAACGSG